MPTIINNPSGSSESNGVFGLIIVGILVVTAVGLFFIYGLPAIRQTNGTSGTKINVPDKIEIDVNTDKGN